MGSVVVAHQMNVQVRRDSFVDRGEELLELDRAVASMQLADHRAIGDVERGEQAGDVVAVVVVGAPFGHPRHHRQDRLGPVQGLDLGFLIDAQHNGSIGWVMVKTNDINDFGHEQRVGGELDPSWT